MTTDRYVRECRSDDAATIAGLQVRAWAAAYRAMLPDDALAELTSEAATARWRDHWRESLTAPPTGRHRVLLAVDEQRAAGFAAFGPATDTDRWPRTDAELYALHVDPDLTGRGNGGRLLNAAVDTLRDDGFLAGYVWVMESDTALTDFLTAAGWGPDGARSLMDIGRSIPTVRLHTGF